MGHGNFFLYLYFRSILKCKADIFFIKNCDKINQAVPEVLIKLRGHSVLPFQFGKEPFYLLLFRLLLCNGIAHFIQPCLCPVKPLCQPVMSARLEKVSTSSLSSIFAINTSFFIMKSS